MEHYLKITSDEKCIDAIPAFDLACFLNGCVDGVECAVTLSTGLVKVVEMESWETYTALNG